MKIYKDTFTGDVIFSDAYKIELVDDVIYKVHGKIQLVTRKSGGVQMSDAIPSEGVTNEDEETEAVESGIDIVLNHGLQETCFDKQGYINFFKEYSKKVVDLLQEKSPDQVDVFKTNTNKFMEGLLGRFKDLQFFTGESMLVLDGGMVVLLEHEDVDGKEIPVPVIYAFKHGLDEEEIFE